MAAVDQGGPLVWLAALTSKLLGRALSACLATSGTTGAGEHTVVVELQQSPQRPGLLELRVCDDGVPLPSEHQLLERCAAELGDGLGRPLFLDSALLVQATGLNEVVVRRYSFQAGSRRGSTQHAAVVEAPADAKPPGSTLRGTVAEAMLVLGRQGLPAGGSGSSSGSTHGWQLPSSDDVVACLQQLLGMLRVLAPPVRLLLRLNDVLLQAPDGSLQAVSGTRRIDLPLPASLDALARFGEGMASEFLPPPPAQQQLQQQQGQPPAVQGSAAAAESVLDAAVLASGSEESTSYEGGAELEPAGTAAAAAAGALPGSGDTSAAHAGGLLSDRCPLSARDAAAAAAPAGAPPSHAPPPAGVPPPLPLLTYVGVGEAGWGCPGAAQHFRGCKWTARAGLVLQLPDHSRLPRGAAAALQEAAEQRGALPETPVFLFRSWAMQLEVQQQALRGLQRCDWGGYGFQLDRAVGSAEGPLRAVLQCAQPRSGAQLVAAVVHLVPCDYWGPGQPPPALSARYESCLVRAALEGALRQLKQQCPGVMSSRRERSLARALPLLSRSLAGILHQSAECSTSRAASSDGGSALDQACNMVGCTSAELQAGLQHLLHDTVAAALDGGGSGEGGSGGTAGGGGGEGVSKRQRHQQHPSQLIDVEGESQA